VSVNIVFYGIMAFISATNFGFWASTGSPWNAAIGAFWGFIALECLAKYLKED
jgi:hypothetical protein